MSCRCGKWPPHTVDSHMQQMPERIEMDNGLTIVSTPTATHDGGQGIRARVKAIANAELNNVADDDKTVIEKLKA